ncbi:uncharacterized protein [Lolium perenne]|uniref:uncharacterized protein isoform X2 n=1 Tax=Lolium perenne TaxID=4522 RepID=UPI003A98E55E
MVPAAARSPLRAVMKRTERREPDGRIFAGSLPAARVVAVAQQFFSTTMTASTQQVVERYILIEAAGVRGQGEEAARASVQQLTECHEESLPGTEAFLLGQEGNSGVGFIARYGKKKMISGDHLGKRSLKDCLHAMYQTKIQRNLSLLQLNCHGSERTENCKHVNDFIVEVV